MPAKRPAKRPTAKPSARKPAKPRATKQWELAPSTAPPKLQLTAAERAAFADCHIDHVVRVGDALVGFERGSPDNQWTDKVIVYRHARTRTLDDVESSFRGFAVAPSGKRLLVLDDKAPGFGTFGGRGRATEVDIDDLATRIAVSALEDTRSDLQLWSVEYLDDDTLVAAASCTSPTTKARLLLFERDPSTQGFRQVHEVEARAQFLATDGTVVATESGKLFGVENHALVPRGTFKSPRGIVFTHPTARGREIRARDMKNKHFRIRG